MLAWLRANWKVAGIIVLILAVALAGAADSYRTRKLLKAAQTQIEEQAKEKKKELAEAKETADRRLSESDRKLAPVLRERDALRARLAGLEAQVPPPWIAPAGDNEVLARFLALGYTVRVRR